MTLKAEYIGKEHARKSPSRFSQGFGRFTKNKAATISAVLLVIIIAACVFAPLLTNYDPIAVDAKNPRVGPSAEHIFGTDELGRDLFARVLYGGRVTLKITFLSELISLVGIFIGIAAGYVGGFTDMVISRITDGLASIPTLLLAILIECILGWGKGNYMYAMAISFIPSVIRLTRSLVMDVMGSEFIEAAKALGCSPVRIIFGHILKNIVAPLIVHISNGLAEALLMCTIMGYLGIGISPPTPEWGNIVRRGFTSLRSYPHVALIPSAIIFVCALSFNIVGNGLRDALTPDSGEV